MLDNNNNLASSLVPSNYFANKDLLEHKPLDNNNIAENLGNSELDTTEIKSNENYDLQLKENEENVNNNVLNNVKIIDKKMIDIDPNANLTLKEFGQLFTKETQVDLSSINDNENIKDNK